MLGYTPTEGVFLNLPPRARLAVAGSPASEGEAILNHIAHK
tara:strand:- start:5948 stop:6070 length:123 start_codon:yes stop_codon:yes gene_type:complete